MLASKQSGELEEVGRGIRNKIVFFSFMCLKFYINREGEKEGKNGSK